MTGCNVYNVPTPSSLTEGHLTLNLLPPTRRSQLWGLLGVCWEVISSSTQRLLLVLKSGITSSKAQGIVMCWGIEPSCRQGK